MAPAFIADKARYLTSDVPPRHLMRPVHSAIRRRPVRSTGKQCAASAFNETCPFRWQAACLSIPLANDTPMLPHALHASSLVRTKEATIVSQHCVAADIWAPEDLSGVTCISCSMYFFHYVPGPTCQGSTTLYVPPLGYKREDTQRYKARSLRPNSSSQAHRLLIQLIVE